MKQRGDLILYPMYLIQMVWVWKLVNKFTWYIIICYYSQTFKTSITATDRYYSDYIEILTDSLDELWDCSSNEEHDEETDSDTCEDATILQKIQRQANINKVVESITKHFGGNNKKNNTTANFSALEKSLPLPHQEEGNVITLLIFFDNKYNTLVRVKLCYLCIRFVF